MGTNRAYVKTIGSTSSFFGYDLGYDKTLIKSFSKDILGSFSAAQYNGNISGMAWKSMGDNKLRKYDFTYDPGNRLIAANFEQYNEGNNRFDLSDGIDFSVDSVAYDANGNITAQQQKGLKMRKSILIDDLEYNYKGNQLLHVLDKANDSNTRLGDFRASNNYISILGGSKGPLTTDYTYDRNGNMLVDKNKDITAVTYNYLNLPQTIEVKGKGSIEYVYDALGNKLKKLSANQANLIKSSSICWVYMKMMFYNICHMKREESGINLREGSILFLTIF